MEKFSSNKAVREAAGGVIVLAPKLINVSHALRTFQPRRCVGAFISICSFPRCVTHDHAGTSVLQYTGVPPDFRRTIVHFYQISIYQKNVREQKVVALRASAILFIRLPLLLD